MTKPHVYIASPYTQGDTAVNVNFQLGVCSQLMDDGLVRPHAPLLKHFLHVMRPRPYEDWLEHDLATLHFYDACLRLHVVVPHLNYLEYNSAGADREVARFREMNKPVFFSIECLYEWVRGRAA